MRAFLELAPDPVFAAPLARAVKSDRVTELGHALRGLLDDGAFSDPSLFPQPRSDRHARRLLYRDAELGFSVVAMTWSPGQGSALHSHAGFWGAEIIARGTMREVPFQLIGEQADRYRFVPGDAATLVAGNVSTLNPPAEYHEFGNTGESPAHTVHVYSGEIERCTTFSPDTGTWWRAGIVHLGYDG